MAHCDVRSSFLYNDTVHGSFSYSNTALAPPAHADGATWTRTSRTAAHLTHPTAARSAHRSPHVDTAVWSYRSLDGVRLGTNCAYSMHPQRCKATARATASRPIRHSSSGLTISLRLSEAGDQLVKKPPSTVRRAHCGGHQDEPLFTPAPSEEVLPGPKFMTLIPRVSGEGAC